MKRLDITLVERGHAPSRTKAQELISSEHAQVLLNGEWQTITQASFAVGERETRIRPDSEVLRYVSRGGLKLESALNHLKIDVRKFRCLDVGLSTGGFTDCLLQRGAATVCGFDVGHGQLAAKLAHEIRLIAFAGVHVKDMSAHPGITAWLAHGVDLFVADLSFISLIKVLPDLNLPPGTRLLALVKPQFEVGPEHLNKRGIANENLFDDVKGRVLLALQKYGFSIEDYFPSSVKGQDGNQEFFAFARRI